MGDVDFFGEKDLHQIKIFNDVYNSPIDRCLHHVFKDRALLHPDRVAIHATDASQTYGELDALSSSLALKLMATGVGPDVLVPLYFKRSSMMVVSMIAVLKAGGGYVPLDPSQPKERLQYIINEIGAKLLLCSEGYEDVCHSLGAPIVVSVNLLSLKSHKAALDTSNSAVRPNNIAYVMFTSGSTGQPKGVVLEHSAITTSLLANGPRHGFEEHLRVLQFEAYTSHVSVMEIFSTLLFGGCLCIPTEEDHLVTLPQIINEMQVQMAILTPTTVMSLLSPELVPGLSTLILVGEAMTQRTVLTWSQKVRLINNYGPTETCIGSASSLVTNPEFHAANIGTAAAAQLWIVEPERTDKLTPIGCVGELLISGPTLARGYLNNIEMTNGAFIDGEALSWGKDALGSWTRLYKTGDLARYNTDGSIMYVRRKDTQLQLRRLRIEVSEIEHHLSLCPEICNVAVESTGSLVQFEAARLIAFVCFREVSPQEEDCVLKLDEKIKDRLSKAAASLSDVLPSYMIPSIFLPLGRMPLTVSGKPDRKALRKILSQLSPEDLSKYRSGEICGRSPATALARKMQALWASVLQLALTSIGLNDHFFWLGGDSMSAIRLATAGRSEGLNFTVAFVFKHPRLGEMVNALESEGHLEIQRLVRIQETEVSDTIKTLAARACGITVADVEDVYPCSPLQEGLMALSYRFAGAYVAQIMYELAPGVDLGRFRSAWETTVKNNSILRTRIIEEGGDGVGSLQVVCRESLKLEWHMETSLEGTCYIVSIPLPLIPAAHSTILEYTKRNRGRPSESGRPLISFGLIANGNVEGEKKPVYFALTLHHAVS